MDGLNRTIDATRVDILALMRERRVWGIVLGAIVLLGWAGPFGSYGFLDLPSRLAMWAIVVGAAFSTGLVSFFVVHNLLPARLSGTLAGSVVATLLTTLPVCLTALMVDRLFVDVPITLERFGSDWINLAPFVLAMVLLIGSTRSAQRSVEAHRDSAENRTPFLARLRRDIAGDLHSLSSQDHYISVKTARGTDLVLMRFSDAVRELGGYDGMQIHRSHWVARCAVAGNERRNGRLLLVLRDGSRLPVSRSFVAALRAADYLPRLDPTRVAAAGPVVRASQSG